MFIARICVQFKPKIMFWNFLCFCKQLFFFSQNQHFLVCTSQSATTKLTVLTVGSYYVFGKKTHFVGETLPKTWNLRISHFSNSLIINSFLCKHMGTIWEHLEGIWRHQRLPGTWYQKVPGTWYQAFSGLERSRRGLFFLKKHVPGFLEHVLSEFCQFSSTWGAQRLPGTWYQAFPGLARSLRTFISFLVVSILGCAQSANLAFNMAARPKGV